MTPSLFSRYVLQNHSLFLIAEQPPADMASLFTLFKPSVPPVVKRRAKELLMIIAEAVKKSLSSTQPNVTESETSNTIQIEQVDKTGTQEDAVMELEAGVKNPDQERREQKNIWGGGMFLLLSTPPYSSVSGSNNEQDCSFRFNISFVVTWSLPVFKIFKGTYYTTYINHYWCQLIVRQQGWKTDTGECARICTAGYCFMLRRRSNVPRLVQTVPTLQRWLPKSIAVWLWHLLSLK